MNSIIRMWNQNRKKIIIIVLIVAFCFLVLQILNNIAKENIRKQNMENKINNENISDKKLPTTSIITGEKVNKQTTENNVKIIEEFSNMCNEGKIQEAYNLLTPNCKQALFETVEDFKNNYYDIIFKETRTTKIENYKNSVTTNTYAVTFYEDIISTGNVGQANNYKDYITIEKDTNKLNINSLITSKNIEKENTKSGIEVKALRQEIYIDYEIYKFEFQNNTQNTVLLDTLKNSKSIYILDRNGIKYGSFATEVASSLFELPMYTTKSFSIKFNKRYNPVDETKKIVFSDIILNYEQYKQQNTNERESIEIKL